jgi:hypothetical protein
MAIQDFVVGKYRKAKTESRIVKIGDLETTGRKHLRTDRDTPYFFDL